MKTTKRIREIAESISILADNLEYWLQQLYEAADDADERRKEDENRERSDSETPRAVRTRDTADATDDGRTDADDADDAARNAVGHLAMLLGVGHKAARDERQKE